MKKVCIVGNSDGVLRTQLGSIIDQFDIVIRFNTFEIQGYEPWVGSKTDYVVLHDNFMELSKTTHEDKNIIGIPYFKHNPKEILPNDRILWIPNCEERAEETRVWHTGIHVVCYFAGLPDHEIYVHGIGDGGKSHYFDKKFKVWPKHDLEYEEGWINKNGIKRLVDHF